MSITKENAGEAQSLAGLLLMPGPVALFLDFDGVIAEIAPTPDSVVVTGAMLSQLQTVNSALDGALAVLSGREIDDLDARLAPLSLAVAGDHGNARRTANGQLSVLNELAGAAASAVFDELSGRFAADPRILVEKKPSAVAVHYRLAPERERDCIDAVTAAIRSHPELSLVAGKMVIEARATGANKGEALRDFMGEAPFFGRTPIFIGDDVTDEDGFAAVQQIGGVGIKVGEGETVAQYRIGGPREVAAILAAIIRQHGGLN